MKAEIRLIKDLLETIQILMPIAELDNVNAAYINELDRAHVMKDYTVERFLNKVRMGGIS